MATTDATGEPLAEPAFNVLTLNGQLLLAGVVTLVLGLVVWLIVVALRRRKAHAQAVAAEQGWTCTGLDRFTGQVHGCAWRGGARQGETDLERWTEFQGALPGLASGGFALRPRSAWTATAVGQALRADDPDTWPALAVGPAEVQQRWVFLASAPHWAAAWTPAVQALWLQAHPKGKGDIRVTLVAQTLTVHRDDRGRDPNLPAVVVLLQLGQALMQAALAAANAAGQPAPGSRSTAAS